MSNNDKQNDIRYNLYTEFSPDFKFKTYNGIDQNDNIITDYLNKLPNGSSGAIEKSFDFDFVKKNLLDKLSFFIPSNVLFHNYIKLVKINQKYPFIVQQLHVMCNLLLLTNIKIDENEINTKNKNDLVKFLIKNYENKKINGIYIGRNFVNFDKIDLEKEKNGENSKTSRFTLNQLYILHCYKNGFFNYYNHIIDVVNECSNFNGDVYYCNRIKIGAIKTLQYYILTELLMKFLTDIKTNQITLSSTIYNDITYDCNTKIDSVETSQSLLENDIKFFVDSYLNLTSTMNIETELIDQKYFRNTTKESNIKNQEKDITILKQDENKTQNIVETLDEKNKDIYNIVRTNYYKNLVMAVVMIIYIIINVIVINNKDTIGHTVLLLINIFIFIIMILILYFDLLKNNIL